MNQPGLTRRDWLGLGAVGTAALAAGHYLRRGQPLGDDVSAVIDTSELLNASGFPLEGPTRGALTMLVFSDYACGVCRKVEPWWREAMREAGNVRVVHRDWPILGAASRRAARVALAADQQGHYLPVHDALMRGRMGDEGMARSALAAAGGDWSRLEADLVAHSDAIDALIARTAQDALQLGLRGTPGFLIGPIRIEGGASERQFADAISRARAS